MSRILSPRFTLLVVGVLLVVGASFPFLSWHRLLRDGPPVYEMVAEAGLFQVAVSREFVSSNSAAQGAQGRILKVSVPFREAPLGCEFIYGAAVFDFARGSPGPAYYVSKQPRYLIRFRYDHVHQRCESKDLTILSADIPERIRVQLIRVTVTSDAVIETPNRIGIELTPQLAVPTKLTVSLTEIPEQEPFISPRRTLRVTEFSTDTHPGEVEVLFAPYESIGNAIVSSIDARRARCERGEGCDSIRGAISVLGDPSLQHALQRASEAGMPVEIVANMGPRSWGELKPHETPLEMVPTPWFWLRGNYYFGNLRGFIPMHLKFIILGDDEVISNGSPHLFDWFYTNRDMALRYRNREIVKIFREILTMTRTALYYPIRVDTSKSVSILFNSRRPRGYAASSRSPFVQMIDREVPSSAFGILFSLLDATRGRLELSMTPLSNTCERYGSNRYCFYDVLKKLARDERLALHLNLHFFLDAEYRYWRKRAPVSFTNPEILNSGAMRGTLEKMRALFAGAPERIALRALARLPDSSHHLRGGILSPDTVIGGSANFAFPFTTNSIEIVRDRTLYWKAKSEFETFKEPYFIVEVPGQRRRKRYGRCEFVFERELLRDATHPERAISRMEIEREMHARYGVELGSDVRLVKPQWSERIFLDGGAPEEPSFHLSTIETEVFSASSYLCLEQGGSTFIVKVLPHRES